jgi:hypothetical protein
LALCLEIKFVWGLQIQLFHAPPPSNQLAQHLHTPLGQPAKMEHKPGRLYQQVLLAALMAIQFYPNPANQFVLIAYCI